MYSDQLEDQEGKNGVSQLRKPQKSFPGNIRESHSSKHLNIFILMFLFIKKEFIYLMVRLVSCK